MNGKYKFCALWTCGCVLSERALKEVDITTCHICATEFDKDDVIILNPVGDDVELMVTNMERRREKIKMLRKQKKERKSEKRKVETNGITSNGCSTHVFEKPHEVVPKKVKKTDLINGDSSSSSTVPPKKAAKDNDKKRSANNVSVDPTKSKVYKSLFTSSEDFKNRPKEKNAHWVTYNPYHL